MENIRKNTDYSASAVKMVNDLNLQIDLTAYHGLSAQIEGLKAKIDAVIPQEMKDQLSSWETQLNACTQAVKADIETYGSYQDLELGWYAVKQRAVSKSYDAKVFKDIYPQFSPAVIVETVNEKALSGLIKGGLITEADLKTIGVIKESESYRYIIK